MTDERPDETARGLLRHALATLAYRGGKALHGAPPEFAAFRAAEGARTPAQVLAHIGDLLDWSLTIAAGAPQWKQTPPASWDADVARFFEALRRFDGVLASDAPLGYAASRIFQGPIADALTHVGQITMLRRISGAPMRSESYFQADIRTGQVGPAQSSPRFEFD